MFPASQSILWQQAISMGLPLVVGRVVGDSIVQDIDCLNQQDDIEVLEREQVTAGHIAQVIRELINNPARRAAMAEGAEKITAEWLNWDKLILKTLRFN